ncbi:MAG: CHAT domain-containing protein [Myxococcota bacterium]
MQRGAFGGRLARVLATALFALAGGPGATFAEAGTASPTGAPEQSVGEAARLHRELLALAALERARGSLGEGLAAAQEALRLAEQMNDPLRAAVSRVALGELLAATGEDARAAAMLEEVVAAAPGLGLPDVALVAEIALAEIALVGGERGSARDRLLHVEARAALPEQFDLRATAVLDRLRIEATTPALPFDDERAGQIEQALDATPDAPEKGLRLVHLGRTLVYAAEGGDATRARRIASANRVLRRALAVADALPDAAAPRRVRAEALGTLGALYALEARIDEALDLTHRALRVAAQSELEIDAHAWHVQAGELYRRAGDPDRALEAWSRALALAEPHRLALAREAAALGDRGLAPSALLRRHLDLLLQRARSREKETLRLADLRLAQATLERLKGDELRDYYEDECVARARAKRVPLEQAAPGAVVVYPFVLDDRLELLVSAGGRLEQIRVDVSRETLEGEVARFRALLEKRTTAQYRGPARALHRLLVEPLEPILARHPEATLVFVPDGALRTIPMAALHDGERFLIERFAVATTPGLELTDPRPFPRDDPAALLVGLSVASGGLEPLENVTREIRQIRAITGGEVLLDAAFSPGALTQKLEAKPYRLLHVASHAAFDAGREGGFIQTHDGPLAFADLADAIDAGRLRADPLELVVLSACETAEGGERAALGLSGMAVRAGARSAIGSLWRVHDEATAQFMATFYQTLAQPGRSRAEAVRAAQRMLLADPAYRHPYFWSPFLLISSWL